MTAQKLQGVIHEYYFDYKTQTLTKTDMQRVVNDVPGNVLLTQENIICQFNKSVQVIADLTSNTSGRRIFKSAHKFQPLSVEHNNFSKFARNSGD